MLENLHFIHPLWLLALIPLSLLAWRIYLRKAHDSPWNQVIDARLQQLLIVGRGMGMNRSFLWLVVAGWVLAVLALADPAWERKPQPVYQTATARVVVLDLSRSMTATDLKPSRLVRARYKVEDVLDLSAEGQTGLVVYAGDAFTVSPLTRDVNTVRALLKVLDPGIMPVDGNRADLGLLKAGELLRQAGVSNGQILLVADGVDAGHFAASERAAAQLRGQGYRVSVLGVGTSLGAPVENGQKELVRDTQGKVEVERLDSTQLQSLANAGGGKYQILSSGAEDVATLASDQDSLRTERTLQTDAATMGWKEMGPFLAVLLLPFAALAFRRKWLLSMVLVAGLTQQPHPAMASTWDDVWQRKDQQTSQALAAGDFAKAATLATDADRRGSAEYKRGNYQLALDNFTRATGNDADYNRGNALAKMGRYQDAIAAYDQALKINAGNEDARINRAAVEAMLKKQAQSPQQNQKSASSASQKDQSQQGQGQDSKGQSGGGQGTSQKKPESQPAPQGNSGQSSASSANSHDSGAANKTGSNSSDPNQSNQSGKQDSPPDTSGGQSGNPQPAAAQPDKSKNQFAAAAKKLATQGKDANADNNSALGKAADGGASGMQTSANAKARREGNAADGQPLNSEEKIAAEQWLRRIPDDPGTLLRRKFLYQYQQRSRQTSGENQ